MDSNETQKNQPEAPAKGRHHTSIIYLHGIGSPDRHASLGAFLDSLDLFGQKQNKFEIGRPRRFSYKSEINNKTGLIENYIDFKRAIYIGNSEHSTILDSIRVHEGYWVPQSHVKFGILYILTWLILRLLMPFKVMLSPWRAYSSLRLLFLHSLAKKGGPWGALQSLESTYGKFDNWDVRSGSPKGRFADFVTFIRNENAPNAKKVEALALQWKLEFDRHYRKLCIVSFAIICGSVLYFLSLLSMINNVTLNFQIGSNIFTDLNTYLIAIYISAFAYLYYSFRGYLYDVLFWTLRSERDDRYTIRENVVNYVTELIRHVTLNDECRRCVVVGHSLGSAIAVEAILREGLRQKHTNGEALDKLAKLDKIEFVFTIGSPIDRIFSLFEDDVSRSHRYSRLLNEKRLSIALPPFFDPHQKKTIKIVNFWSRFDIISSKLLSPRKSISERRDAIVDLECIPPGSPKPVATHQSYFRDDFVMRNIYWAVMLGRLHDTQSPSEYSHNYLETIRILTVCTIGISVAAFAIFPLNTVAGCIFALPVASLWILLFWATRKMRGTLDLPLDRQPASH